MGRILHILALLTFAGSLVSSAPQDTTVSGIPPLSTVHSSSPDTVARSATDSVAPGATPEEGIHKTRLYIVGGVMAASMIGVHLYQESGWWKYNRAPFHFREDFTYGRSVDKIGHVYGTMLWAYGLRRTLQWTNMREESALYYGSAGAAMFQTFVEVEDGLSAWGFDRVDFLCDLAGAAWPIAQYHSPFMRKFDLKLSYSPSPLLNQHGGGGFAGQKHLLVDDYEGQTFWMAVKVNEFLPEQADPFWPDFLNIAVGYGVRDVSEVSGEAYSVVFIGLDYDMKKIIPQTSSFLVTLSDILNFIHLPAPAIRISPSTILYGLFY